MRETNLASQLRGKRDHFEWRKQITFKAVLLNIKVYLFIVQTSNRTLQYILTVTGFLKLLCIGMQFNNEKRVKECLELKEG
jgi:hypothetical protein